MTFQEMIDEVLQDSFSTQRYTTRVKRWLNEAQGKFARQVDVPALKQALKFTTARSQAFVAVPADWLRTRDVYVLGAAPFKAGDAPVRLKPVDDTPSLVDAAVQTEGLGQPSRYTLKTNTLAWWPFCDVPYDMLHRYFKRPAQMVDVNLSPEIPADYHEALVSYARSKAFRAEDDFDAASAHMADWTAAIVAARVDLQHPTNDGPTITPGMWGC